ncbi:MAG TPA: hypothetical protein VGK19_17820 [Capsulimonadaceae bacterium]|jgi:hypothetical protein
MNTFSPRTFSSDWEIAVLNRKNVVTDNDHLAGLQGQLRAETGLPVQMDWNSIEVGLGVNRSLDQIWNRIVDFTDRATSLAAMYECDLMPSASNPVERYFNAAHVHVGTMHDESAGVRLEAALARYTPVFAALGANSALWNFEAGPWKSWRVSKLANGCTTPISPRSPHTAQVTWGGDASPKLFGAPTLEVRITDCASSRRLLAELATFTAAFVHHLGTKDISGDVSQTEYMEYINNRWLASRYGMQATFQWDGAPKLVGDIVREMLDECAEALAELKTTVSEFRVLNQMADKRICQADFALDIASRYDEPYCLLGAYAKRLRDWDAFDEYLDNAAALEPAAALTHDDVLRAHEAHIGEGTPFYASRVAMFYPPSEADNVLDELVEAGRIERKVMPDGGIILSRTGQ